MTVHTSLDSNSMARTPAGPARNVPIPIPDNDIIL